MKPLMGITSNLLFESPGDVSSVVYRIKGHYAEQIAAAGGAPIILPLAVDDIAEAVMRRLDGLVLSGGSDIPPQFCGAEPNPTCNYMPVERWRSECQWLAAAESLRRPVLGICLGMQVMNVAAGGTLIQDIPSQRSGALAHTGPGAGRLHDVAVVEGSRLAELAPSLAVSVMSAHHQAVDRIAGPYRIVATSADGLIEAIESISGPARMGVQWHPERNPGQPDWLLKGFVRQCGERLAAERCSGVNRGS